jgi:hypothetical protein
VASAAAPLEYIGQAEDAANGVQATMFSESVFNAMMNDNSRTNPVLPITIVVLEGAHRIPFGSGVSQLNGRIDAGATKVFPTYEQTFWVYRTGAESPYGRTTPSSANAFIWQSILEKYAP